METFFPRTIYPRGLVVRALKLLKFLRGGGGGEILPPYQAQKGRKKKDILNRVVFQYVYSKIKVCFWQTALPQHCHCILALLSASFFFLWPSPSIADMHSAHRFRETYFSFRWSENEPIFCCTTDVRPLRDRVRMCGRTSPRPSFHPYSKEFCFLGSFLWFMQ